MIANSTSTPRFVALNRRFIPWADEKASIEMATIWERTVSGRLDWSNLLERQRIIVLAEAGSGKSAELAQQAKLLTAEGKQVFHLTVQELATYGIDGALVKPQRAALDVWRTSNERAYFFVDSIDEAKLDSIRIETAFKKLADGIDGALDRATIIFSGRYTDWEFQSDLNRFETMLPASPTKGEPSKPIAEILELVLSNQWKDKTPKAPEKPLVVLMASLDKSQVRAFASGRGIAAVDSFIAAIEADDLWELAHRPLDLGWLVDYWQTHKRFGTLAEMLEASALQRLRETNSNLARKDPLSEASALEAVERIGAAMVFGRADKILIPDAEIVGADGDFKLESILPDWSEEHRGRLRARPLFDAATFGRVRLHNDNEGAVRSYLAARWLRRRRANGCPISAVFDLLFAETYGLRLVKPSARQTAAWLAIWDEDVAREVISIDPALLLKGGDPSSLSLNTRIAVLKALAERISQDETWYGWLSWPGMRRFSSGELAPTLTRMWNEYPHHEVRVLLLQLMVAGNLAECFDIASDVVFSDQNDGVTRVLAARLFLKFADEGAKTRYAAVVCSTPLTLAQEELDEAISALFPAHISVDQFLQILAVVPQDELTRSRLETYGPQLFDKLACPVELERLTAGLLGHLKAPKEEDIDEETEDEKTHFPILQAATIRLMSVIGKNEISQTAIDATIRLGAHRLYRTNSQDLAPLYALMLATPERRRAGIWRAYETLNGTRFLKGQDVINPHQLEALGWSCGLQHEDLNWLLEDITSRPTEAERKFALVSALVIWRDNEKPEADLQRIEPVARSHKPLSELLDGWLAPPVEEDWEKEHNQKMKSLKKRNAASKAKRTQSWIKFVDDLKADPDALRNLPARSDNSVDGRLFYFWELLSAISRGGSRYQIDDVSPLEPVFGKDVVEAAREGLIQFWRQHTPKVDSQKAPDALNIVSKLDCMGIVGISLEAAANPAWAESLDVADARRAAAYATIELNGFPTWFDGLMDAKPDEVGQVLMEEISSQLGAHAGQVHGVLQNVSYGAAQISKLVAPALLATLEKQPSLPAKSLSAAMTILTKGLSDESDRKSLLRLAIEQFHQAPDADIAGSYLYAAFSIDADAATEAMTEHLDSLDDASQTEYCKKIFPRIFGDRLSGGGIDPSVVPFETLERLVVTAYRSIRLAEDRTRNSGEVYSFDDRDRAEGARSTLYNRLAETPGPATVEALRRVGPIIGISSERTEETVAQRAAQDSESGKWPPSQAYEMERDFDVAPQTAADLQKIAMRRFADIDHDAHNSDFAQGRTLKVLPSEEEVQIWVGNELKNRRHRGYTTERESEVVGNNRPDLRLRSGDVSLPIEVKVAESWSLAELESALSVQLEGRYLRHQDARHGVLLLIHQNARAQGWADGSGGWLTFARVVEHLRAIAVARAGMSHDSAKATVAVIDVSDVELATPKSPARRKSLLASEKLSTT